METTAKPRRKRAEKVNPKDELLRWLRTECDEDDVKFNTDGSKYLGIKTVKDKLRLLRERWGVQRNENGFNHFVFTTRNGDSFASGSLNIELVGEGFNVKLVGAATFNLKEYGENTHYAATLKSLCLCNAMLEYPQFGACLNDDIADVVLPTKENKKITAGIVEQQKLKNAIKNNDENLITELKEKYIFPDVTNK